MAAINSFIKRASSLLGGLAVSGSRSDNCVPPSEGEVIYCKNNVCVHPPNSQLTNINHYPGYLTIKGHISEVHDQPTLVLSWIPNSTLKSNPRSVENRSVTSSPCRSSRSSACPSPRRTSPHHSIISDGFTSSCTSPGHSLCSEKSPDEYSFSHSIFKPIASDNDIRDSQSVSSTTSYVESPADDGASTSTLDFCWTNGERKKDSKSGHGCYAPSHTARKPTNRRKPALDCQADSGIGPEEVSAALESMICGLNDFEQTNFSKNEKVSESQVQLTANIVKENGLTNHFILPSANIEASNTPDDQSLNNDTKTKESPEIPPEININNFGGFSNEGSGITSDNDDSNQSITSSSSERNLGSKYPAPFFMEGTPELLAHAHNLTFPEHNIGTYGYHNARHSTFENTCGVFSVDLAQMRSLRLFYSNVEQTCGQVVIASCQSQYKILHFHYGGLDKLAQVFTDWNFLLKSGTDDVSEDDNQCQHFSICAPTVGKGELHPDDSLYNVVDEDVWKSFMNAEGQILDDFQLRKNIFFGGLDPEIRNETWPFLLHYFSFTSTFSEREQIRNDRYIEYQNIRKKREKMTVAEKEAFYRNIQCTVDKDVVRTDCTNPFFSGENNPNVQMMRNILLNYAIYNPSMGYTQGMSDLLAPILIEIREEAMAFWCFVGLMQRTLFVSSPRDQEMDIHLNYLRELIRILVPKFYNHLGRYEDAKELLFCHRWILLCFKREFKDNSSLNIWEACWAHYQTDFFHMFICSAIICIYGEDVIQQNLPPDEMLLHFSSLALHMDGDLVLRKARGLLHEFRLLPKIPCTLHGLCEMTESSMWDTGRVVTQIECICRQKNRLCPAKTKS